MTVWILHHIHNPDQNNEDVKLIGLYSSKTSGREAIERLSSQPGFNQPDGEFSLEEYELDKDHWTEGFVTLD